MQFKQIIGQDHIKQQWSQMIQSKKVPHSLLLLGDTGFGGLAIATAFAQMLNCENQSPDDSCGQCPSCQKATRLIHPDIHFSFPFHKTEKKETSNHYIEEWREFFIKEKGYLSLSHWKSHAASENSQINIPARECKEIIRKLQLKSYEGNFKTMIIWLPEYLGKEGNILLKILEEPPEKTVFILVAENQAPLLPTLLSRTQITNILPIEGQALKEALLHHPSQDTNEEEIQQIIHWAHGNYITALDLLHNQFHKNTQAFYEWLHICFNTKKQNTPDCNKQLIEWIEKFNNEGKETQKEIILFGLHFFEQLLTLPHRNSSQSSNIDLQNIQLFQPYFPPQRFPDIFQLLNQSIYYLERYANAKILMHSLSLQIRHLAKLS